MDSTSRKNVVLVHGAWMVPASWDRFRNYLELRGYNVTVPTWPYMDRSVEELRKNPHPYFGTLSIGEITDHYEMIIKEFAEPPLIIGHSFGGLITQLLLDRGVGAAGVAIDPAPIGGIIVDSTSLKAALPIFIRWNGWNRPFMMTKEAFDTKFANTAPAEQRNRDYEKYVVPCPGRIFYQAAFSLGTFVNPRRRTQDLLFIAGDQDMTATPFLVKSAYRIQTHSPARTDYKSFPGRSHYLIAEPGWQEVAKYSIDWFERHRQRSLQKTG